MNSNFKPVYQRLEGLMYEYYTLMRGRPGEWKMFVDEVTRQRKADIAEECKLIKETLETFDPDWDEDIANISANMIKRAVLHG